MFRVLRTCTIVLLVLAVAGCGPGSNDGSTGAAPGTARSGTAPEPLAIVTTIDPLTVGTATVTAHVSAGGVPLVGANVKIRGDMTHAGMAPVLGDLTETGAGVYVANDFALQMAGDWIFTVEVETADGRKAQAETFESVAAR